MADFNRTVNLDKGLEKITNDFKNQLSDAVKELQKESEDAGASIGYGWDEGFNDSIKKIKASSLKLDEIFDKLNESINKQVKKVKIKDATIDIDFSKIDINSDKIQERVNSIINDFKDIDLIEFDVKGSEQQFKALITLYVKYQTKLKSLESELPNVSGTSAVKNLQQQLVLATDLQKIFNKLQHPDPLRDYSNSIRKIGEALKIAQQVVGETPSSDGYKDLLDTLNEIKESLSTISDVFKDEKNSMKAMAESGKTSFESLSQAIVGVYDNLTKVQNLVDSISKKDFNINNITQVGGGADSNMQAIKQRMADARDIYSHLSQLYGQATETLSLLSGAGQSKLVMQSIEGIQNLDIDALNNSLRKVRDGANLEGIIGEMEDYIAKLIKINELRNQYSLGEWKDTFVPAKKPKIKPEQPVTPAPVLEAPKVSGVSSHTEAQEMWQLKAAVDEVSKAVGRKNAGFIKEKEIVNESVEAEKTKLRELIEVLTYEIGAALDNIKVGFQESFTAPELDLSNLEVSFSKIYDKFNELKNKINTIEVNVKASDAKNSTNKKGSSPVNDFVKGATQGYTYKKEDLNVIKGYVSDILTHVKIDESDRSENWGSVLDEKINKLVDVITSRAMTDDGFGNANPFEGLLEALKGKVIYVSDHDYSEVIDEDKKFVDSSSRFTRSRNKASDTVDQVWWDTIRSSFPEFFDDSINPGLKELVRLLRDAKNWKPSSIPHKPGEEELEFLRGDLKNKILNLIATSMGDSLRVEYDANVGTPIDENALKRVLQDVFKNILNPNSQYHAMSRDEATGYLAENRDYNLWQRWYGAADGDARTEIANMVSKDAKLRNAALNQMWDDYKHIYKTDIPFEEFLNTKIPLYRGKTFADSTPDKHEAFSFSLNKEAAQEFADDVMTIWMKPIDTLGIANPTAHHAKEAEVMVSKHQIANNLGLETILRNVLAKPGQESEGIKLTPTMDEGAIANLVTDNVAKTPATVKVTPIMDDGSVADAASKSKQAMDAEGQEAADVAKEFIEAAKAKKKFVESNKQVKESAEKSADAINQEAQATQNTAVSPSGDLIKTKDVFSGLDTTNEEMLETHEDIYKDIVDGAEQITTIREETTYSDGERFKVYTTTIVRDMEKLAKQEKKDAQTVAKAQKKLGEFLARFRSKTGGQADKVKGFNELEALYKNGGVNKDNIETIFNDMTALQQEYANLEAKFRKGQSSLNPFVNSINKAENIDNLFATTEQKFQGLVEKSDDLIVKFEELKKLYKDIQDFMAFLTDPDLSGAIEPKDFEEFAKKMGQFTSLKAQIEGDIRLEGKGKANRSKYVKDLVKLESQLGQKLAIQEAKSTQQGWAEIANLQEEIDLKKQVIELTQEEIELLERASQTAYDNQKRINAGKKEDQNLKDQIKQSKDEARYNKVQSAKRAGKDAIWQLGTLNIDEKLIYATPEVNALNNALKELDKIEDNIKANGGIVTDKDSKDLMRVTGEIHKHTAAVKVLTQNYKMFNETNAIDFNQKLIGGDVKQQFLDAASAMYGTRFQFKSFDEEMKVMTGTIKVGAYEFQDITIGVDQFSKAIKGAKGEIRKTETFMESFKRKFGQIMHYFSASSLIYKAFNELRKGIQYVRDIDLALTELKKVTDETDESYERFLNSAAKTANKVGSTIKEIVSSTADWARIGYSLKEAATLAETTSVLLNVSEFQSIDEATSALTSTLQAFSYTAEQSMDVVDVLNEVGNNFAISSDGIATALKDSASSLVAANNSYQEAVALIAAANKVVQDPNSVGKMLCRR